MSCPSTDCHQAPATAVTPAIVPIRTSPPDRDGETKSESCCPLTGTCRLICCLIWPVAGASSYSAPVPEPATHTAPPPTTGEPEASAGACQMILRLPPAVSTAVTPSLMQGT